MMKERTSNLYPHKCGRCSSLASPSHRDDERLALAQKVPEASAIDRTLKIIVDSGKTCGMPATSENVAATIARGVRYIYTHVPTVLRAGAAAYLSAGRQRIS